MADRLPPLNALRAFEAASRHLSFAKAAEELNVTPAALSFQIKNLEEHLGEPLFHRLNRAVTLTEAGRTLAPGVGEGFTALAAAWSAARRLSDDRTLTVTAGPGFTSKWLAPRLFHFAQAHPDIDLRFSAALRMMDFSRDEVDVAIRFGQSPDDGLYSETIMEEWMTPMVTPELAKTLRTPADLTELSLIHQDDTGFLSPKVDWNTWFEAAGVEGTQAAGVHFSQADHAVNAAVSGAGAILGRVTLTESHLREGQLVMPFGLTLRTHASYRLVCPMGQETRPQVARFMEWVRAEMTCIVDLSADRQMVDPAGF